MESRKLKRNSVFFEIRDKKNWFVIADKGMQQELVIWLCNKESVITEAKRNSDWRGPLLCKSETAHHDTKLSDMNKYFTGYVNSLTD